MSSDLARLMSAALQLEQHIPPHLRDEWTLIRDAAMREGGRQFAQELIQEDSHELADLVSLEWYRERGA